MKGSESSTDSGINESYGVSQTDSQNDHHGMSLDDSFRRKRGRPRKNPEEPRRKRGAIEYDHLGDSCTPILEEHKRNLIARKLGLHWSDRQRPKKKLMRTPEGQEIEIGATSKRDPLYNFQIDSIHHSHNNAVQ